MFKQSFLLLLLCFVFVNAQSYLWPTNASNFISSSFCEYRPTHYHAAIDIKTWNTEGYPCYAVANGKIEQIRISPFGYGKVLYLKMDDGRTAVYAHLQKFNDDLEKQVREQQISNRIYSLTWWPKNWRVKKGEVIAYTGQTGIGVPHLHFEIRDEKNRPLNPLQFYSDKIKDTRAPLIQEIMVIPQTALSNVNGSFVPSVFEVIKRQNVYYLNEPVHASGKIGIAIRGYDMADQVTNKYGFYKTELFVNGEKKFHIQYDQKSFDKTRQVNVEIYYPFKKETGKRFHKLYIEPFNTLDHYVRSFGDGFISVTDTTNCRIVISDFFGNSNSVEFTLINSPRAKHKLLQTALLGKTAYIKTILPDRLSKLAFYSGESVSLLNKINYYEILERVSQNNGLTEYLLKLDLNSKDDRFLKTDYVSGEEEQTQLIQLQNSDGIQPKFKLNYMGKFLLLKILNFNAEQEDIKLEIVSSDTLIQRNIFVNNNQPELVLTPDLFKDDSLRIRLKRSDIIISDTLLNIIRINPLQSLKKKFFDGNILIETNQNSLYDTLLFTLAKDTITTGFDIPTDTTLFSFFPDNVIFDRGINIALKDNLSHFYGQKTAIFETTNREKFSFVSNSKNENGFLVSNERSLGNYFVAADTVLPEISIYSLKQPIKNNKITFDVKDEHSGIAVDEIIVFFDDEQLIAEWDPERDRVFAHLHFKPQSGSHKVRITATDRVGNIKDKTYIINTP